MAVSTSIFEAEIRKLLKSATPSLADADELVVDVALELTLGVASECTGSVSEMMDSGRFGTCVASVVVTSCSARAVE